MVLLKDGRQRIEDREQTAGGRRAYGIILTALLSALFCDLSSVAYAAEKVYKINVEGMHCNMCVYRVTKSLKKLKQVKDVDVSLDNGTATVTLNDGDDVTAEALNEAIDDSGYKPNGIEVLGANVNSPEKN